MPNSIEYAKRFMPIIDGIYKAAAVTQGMDAATRPDFSGVNEVKVLKVSTTGLGDYSREKGYPKGDVTAAWETMQLTEEEVRRSLLTVWTMKKLWDLLSGQLLGSL